MHLHDQYHFGYVVDDLDEAQAWFSESIGHRFCEEMTFENLFVRPDGESTTIPLRLTYSRDEPRLELIQSLPGTIFTPTTLSFHVGYWTDDIDADVAVLEKMGGLQLGKAYWTAGGDHYGRWSVLHRARP